MSLCDSFVMPTHSMVLATRDASRTIESVATHPAPQSLVENGRQKIFADSNADAAMLCRQGRADACVTTTVAAHSHSHALSIIHDFGPVLMAFLIHALK